jgi:type IV pilus assembly protein PilW
MMNSTSANPSKEHGASLIELMVGITIGLLVVLAAIGTIVLTRTSGMTVADSSLMISQGNNAMRLLGSSLRQAGAIEVTPVDSASPVGEQLFLFSNAFAGMVVQGTEGGAAPDTLITAQEGRAGNTVIRDCLGAITAAARIQNTFTVVGTNLRCLGSGNATEQPIAENVEDFQVFYWVQIGAGAATTQQRMNATQVVAAGGWNNPVSPIVAIDVCLQLRGDQAGHPVAAGSTFINCQGTNTVRDSRLHQVFRSTFKLRNQGQ